MKLFLPTFALFCSFAACAHGAELEGVDWKQCGDKSLVSVSSVEVSPSPIKAGSPATFKLKSTQEDEIKSGKLVASVRYMGFRVYEKTGDLCSAVNCPFGPGQVDLAFEQDMPSVMPPGKLVLTLHAVGEGEENLFCVDIVLPREQAGSWW